MPQLDFTTYSSQIFWFLICFITLYIASSRFILPRITEIIKSRKNIIESDLSLAQELDDKIYNLESETKNLRAEAIKKYQSKLEEASKLASKEREDMIEKLKEKIDQDILKSHDELKNLISKSEAESQIVIDNLTQQIKQKLINA